MVREMGTAAVYFDALVLASLGRAREAVQLLEGRERDGRSPAIRDFVASLRALLEGKPQESREATERSLAHFRDPEGRYYLARQLARLGDHDRALQELRTIVDEGFYCPQALAGDAWLDPLRSSPDFAAILERAKDGRRQAAARFIAGGGEALLGVRPA